MNPIAPTGVRTTWDIDTAHSSVTFTVRHLMFAKVHGRFTRWSGVITVDEPHPEDSRIEVRIETASVDTHDDTRDNHLRSPDFFDSANHPEMTFVSTHVEKAADDRYRMDGDLTIRGVTRPVTLDVEMLGRAKDPWGKERAVFSARTSVDRTEFGLRWNQPLEGGGVLVSNKVDIEIEIEAVLRSDAPSA